MPPGADTIVIQENTTRDGDNVVVTSGSPAGKHIRRAGLDFKQGAVLLAKGRRLNDRDLMLAAAMNHPTAAGAPPSAGCRARHRRRAGAARRHARSR